MQDSPAPPQARGGRYNQTTANQDKSPGWRGRRGVKAHGDRGREGDRGSEKERGGEKDRIRQKQQKQQQQKKHTLQQGETGLKA